MSLLLVQADRVFLSINPKTIKGNAEGHKINYHTNAIFERLIIKFFFDFITID